MLLNSDQISEFIIESEYSKRAQVGIDLSVCKIEKINVGSIVKIDGTIIDPKGYETEGLLFNDEMPKGFWLLGPGVYSVTFNEGIKMPNDCGSIIINRSSLYRTGTIINSPWFDPGFYCDNINTTMIVHNRITIEKNARLAQISFWRMEKEGEIYNGQFQNLSTAYKTEEHVND